MKNAVLTKERVDKHKELAVHENFPFTRIQKYFIHKHSVFAPKWVIELLYQYYTVNDVGNIVKAINNKSQFVHLEDGKDPTVGEEEDYVYLEPMVHFLT